MEVRRSQIPFCTASQSPSCRASKYCVLSMAGRGRVAVLHTMASCQLSVAVVCCLPVVSSDTRLISTWAALWSKVAGQSTRERRQNLLQRAVSSSTSLDARTKRRWPGRIRHPGLRPHLHSVQAAAAPAAIIEAASAQAESTASPAQTARARALLLPPSGFSSPDGQPPS